MITDSPMDGLRSRLMRSGRNDVAGEAGSIEREVMYEALSNKRRRYTIHYLLQHDGSADLTDLSRRLAAWEYDVPVKQVTAKQRKRVYTALRQAHLPKLDEFGLISFDCDRGTVRSTEATDKARYYLRVVPENEITWSSFYLGLGLISVTLTLFAWAGLFPFTEMPGYGWGVGSGFAVAVTGAVHHLSDRRHRVGQDGPPPG